MRGGLRKLGSALRRIVGGVRRLAPLFLWIGVAAVALFSLFMAFHYLLPSWIACFIVALTSFLLLVHQITVSALFPGGSRLFQWQLEQQLCGGATGELFRSLRFLEQTLCSLLAEPLSAMSAEELTRLSASLPPSCLGYLVCPRGSRSIPFPPLLSQPSFLEGGVSFDDAFKPARLRQALSLLKSHLSALRRLSLRHCAVQARSLNGHASTFVRRECSAGCCSFRSLGVGEAASSSATEREASQVDLAAFEVVGAPPPPWLKQLEKRVRLSWLQQCVAFSTASLLESLAAVKVKTTRFTNPQKGCSSSSSAGSKGATANVASVGQPLLELVKAPAPRLRKARDGRWCVDEDGGAFCAEDAEDEGQKTISDIQLCEDRDLRYCLAALQQLQTLVLLLLPFGGPVWLLRPWQGWELLLLALRFLLKVPLASLALVQEDVLHGEGAFELWLSVPDTPRRRRLFFLAKALIVAALTGLRRLQQSAGTRIFPEVSAQRGGEFRREECEAGRDTLLWSSTAEVTADQSAGTEASRARLLQRRRRLMHSRMTNAALECLRRLRNSILPKWFRRALLGSDSKSHFLHGLFLPAPGSHWLLPSSCCSPPLSKLSTEQTLQFPAHALVGASSSATENPKGEGFSVSGNLSSDATDLHSESSLALREGNVQALVGDSIVGRLSLKLFLLLSTQRLLTALDSVKTHRAGGGAASPSSLHFSSSGGAFKPFPQNAQFLLHPLRRRSAWGAVRVALGFAVETVVVVSLARFCKCMRRLAKNACNRAAALRSVLSVASLSSACRTCLSCRHSSVATEDAFALCVSSREVIEADRLKAEDGRNSVSSDFVFLCASTEHAAHGDCRSRRLKCLREDELNKTKTNEAFSDPSAVQLGGDLLIYLNPNAGFAELTAASSESDVANYRRRGISVLVFNYRGYSSSSGSVDLPECLFDAKCIFDFAASLPGVRKVGLHGRSIGGLPASFVALLESQPLTLKKLQKQSEWLPPKPRVSFLCMDRTFHSLDSAAAHLVGVWAKWSVYAAAVTGAASSGRSEDAFSSESSFPGEGFAQRDLTDKEVGEALAQPQKHFLLEEGRRDGAEASFEKILTTGVCSRAEDSHKGASLGTKKQSGFSPSDARRTAVADAIMPTAVALSACMRRASCTEAFLSVRCPKVLVYDPSDAVVREGASLKSDVARRISEVLLQRMEGEMGFPNSKVKLLHPLYLIKTCEEAAAAWRLLRQILDTMENAPCRTSCVGRETTYRPSQMRRRSRGAKRAPACTPDLDALLRTAVDEASALSAMQMETVSRKPTSPHRQSRTSSPLKNRLAAFGNNKASTSASELTDVAAFKGASFVRRDLANRNNNEVASSRAAVGVSSVSSEGSLKKVKIVAVLHDDQNTGRRRTRRWRLSSDETGSLSTQRGFPSDGKEEEMEKPVVLTVGSVDVCEWLAPLAPFFERLDLSIRKVLNAGGLPLSAALEANTLAGPSQTLLKPSPSPLSSFSTSLRVWGASPSPATAESLLGDAASSCPHALCVARRRRRSLVDALRKKRDARKAGARGGLVEKDLGQEERSGFSEETDGQSESDLTPEASDASSTLEGWERNPKKWIPLLRCLRPFMVRDLIFLFADLAERLHSRLLPVPSRAARLHNPSLDISSQEQSLPSFASGGDSFNSSQAPFANTAFTTESGCGEGSERRDSGEADEEEEECAPGRFFSGISARRPSELSGAELALQEQEQLREIFKQHGMALKRSVLRLQQRQQQPLQDDASRLTQQFALLRMEVEELKRMWDSGLLHGEAEQTRSEQVLSLLLHLVGKEQRLLEGRPSSSFSRGDSSRHPQRNAPSPLLKAFKSAFGEVLESDDSLTEDLSYASSLQSQTPSADQNATSSSSQNLCLQIRAWMRLVACAATLRLSEHVSSLMIRQIQNRLLKLDSAESLVQSTESPHSQTEELLSLARSSTRECFLDALLLRLVPLAELTDELSSIFISAEEEKEVLPSGGGTQSPSVDYSLLDQISGMLLPVHCGHNGEVSAEDVPLLELAMEAAQFGTKNF